MRRSSSGSPKRLSAPGDSPLARRGSRESALFNVSYMGDASDSPKSASRRRTMSDAPSGEVCALSRTRFCRASIGCLFMKPTPSRPS